MAARAWQVVLVRLEGVSFECRPVASRGTDVVHLQAGRVVPPSRCLTAKQFPKMDHGENNKIQRD